MATYQLAHNILMSCSEQNAQYIIHNDILYRDNWMMPETKEFHPVTASVIKIDADEYDKLATAFEKDEDTQIPQDEPSEPETPLPTNPVEEITIDFLKEKKIAEMSKTCNAVIEKGFDVVLSDNISHHFSLSLEDQSDITGLTIEMMMGATEASYHADGEPCQYYSVEDMEKIIAGATFHRKYHLSYFNSLRSYIQELTSIEEVSNITYGTEIPVEYQTDVLKDLLAQLLVMQNENN